MYFHTGDGTESFNYLDLCSTFDFKQDTIGKSEDTVRFQLCTFVIIL
jgi:hypothetical protein